MKYMAVLAAMFGSLTLAVRAEDAAAVHEHKTVRQVKLEQACGSCHNATAFVSEPLPYALTDVVYHAHADLRSQGQETKKAAFLGVGVEKPTDTVRAQLKLPEGVGLVVTFVEEKSPAKEAGVRQHDLITKLEDQLLVNEEQLVTLVRMKKTGETVKLQVVREARPMELSVRLGEKEFTTSAQWEVLDRDLANDISTSYVAMSAFAPTTQPADKSVATAATRYLSNAAGHGDYIEFLSAINASAGGVMSRSVSVGPLTVDDGTHVVIYTPKEGGVLIALEKASGEILFNGPVGSDEQWQAVPEGVKGKMQELHESFRRGKQNEQARPPASK